MMDISQVKKVYLKKFVEDNGSIVVFEEMVDYPHFKIERVFSVFAEKGSVRGQHAHKECYQFLTCPIGSVRLKCTDGLNKIEILLNSPDFGIFIPPFIWAEQIYEERNTILNVYCNKLYDSNDYIRDFKEFKIFRGINF
jgi:dTDP-4-dehydrorhamnose 3,5-epimerase-like enzyme